MSGGGAAKGVGAERPLTASMVKSFLNESEEKQCSYSYVFIICSLVDELVEYCCFAIALCQCIETLHSILANLLEC